MPLQGDQKIPNKHFHSQTSIPINQQDYQQLIAWTGQAMRKDKAGHLSKQYPPPHIQNTLGSYNINPEHWTETIQNFDQGFFTAVGQIKALIENALNNGKQWCKGKAAALRLYKTH